MKSIYLVLLIAFSSAFYGQKFSTDTVKVYGNCGMCKDRIEDALDVVGVRDANWNEDTQLLIVQYSSKKISQQEIHELCAEVGHATNKMKADKKAYDNLHHCCKYVVHEHEHSHEHEGSGEKSCSPNKSCCKKETGKK